MNATTVVPGRTPTRRAAAWLAGAAIVAVPAAFLLYFFAYPVARILAQTVPFVLPTVVVGSAFLALLGPRGTLGIDLSFTIWAILIAHIFYNFAVVVRTVGGLWSHLDRNLVEAARTLGASRLHAFREITLPLLSPAIAAAASIVFLFTFTSFGVILILGGPAFATLEVEIYRQTTVFLDLGAAAVLAVIQLVGVGLILLVYSRYQERRAHELQLRPVSEVARRPHGRGEWALVTGTLLFTTALLFIPLATLILRSFRVEGAFGLDYYRALGAAGRGSRLFVAPTEAIVNSVGFAVAATVVALVIGVMAAVVIAYRRGTTSQWFDSLLMLPLGTSAVTIGFGFLIALDWPVDLRTSPLLIPVAHALVAIPFVVRILVPVMRSVQQRLREAATVLGASPHRVWTEVDLPIVARAMAVAAGFAFAVSLGEFGATSFIVRPDRPTMPIAIFRFLGQPGTVNFGRAMAMSTILMLVTLAAILAIERFRIGEVGEF
jgi:thiamine transport system permease protein